MYIYLNEKFMIHIILEGLDQSGKTTLITAIEKKYCNILHTKFIRKNNISHADQSIYQRGQFIRAVVQLNSANNIDLIIWDRSHISEYVYAPLYRSTDADWVFNQEKLVFSQRLNQTFLFLLENDIGKQRRWFITIKK